MSDSKHDVKKGNVALSRLNVEYVPIDSIKPNEYNPNRQADSDFELLCKSIRDDGFTQPIVVLRSTRVIVDGEHRWRAGRTVGYKEVPVVFTDMTPAQARIATLRHNRARGEENVELAAGVLKHLAHTGGADQAMEALNLDPVEMEAFLTAVDVNDGVSAAEAVELAGADDETLREKLRDEGVDDSEVEHVSVQDVIRAREDNIKAEKKEAREAARKEDNDVFTIRLVYSSEEATIIRQALGQDIATRLVEMAKANVGVQE